jgi:thiol-disulfide isomerase/thioredoxin
VLVNIWATWCSPCRRETPGFVKLREKYREQGFEVLGVAVQSPETAVRSFVEEYKVTYPIGIKDAVAAQYGTYGLPDTYLFGPDGALIKHFFGFTKEELLEPLITKTLAAIPKAEPPGKRP